MDLLLEMWTDEVSSDSDTDSDTSEDLEVDWEAAYWATTHNMAWMRALCLVLSLCFFSAGFGAFTILWLWSPPIPQPVVAPKASVYEAPSPGPSWLPRPLEALRERDGAIQALLGNWWTAAYSPELIPYLTNQRLLPYWTLGGGMVALMQVCGYPMAGGVLALLGLIGTGRVFPDLWAAPSLQAAMTGVPPAFSMPLGSQQVLNYPARPFAAAMVP